MPIEGSGRKQQHTEGEADLENRPTEPTAHEAVLSTQCNTPKELIAKGHLLASFPAAEEGPGQRKAVRHISPQSSCRQLQLDIDTNASWPLK